MTDRPIIFSAPMVRALLDGRKTQTRRLATSPLRRCAVGDRLYVRETWSGLFWSIDDIDGPAREYWETPKTERTRDLSSGLFYQVDEEAKPSGERFLPEGQWSPSIHMPRWASRLTLIVEGVKVEPLQAISEADAVAEGVRSLTRSDGPYYYTVDIDGGGLSEATAAMTYKLLWNVLHGEESWAANPDVVALTFRVVRGNIDRIAA